MRNARCAVCAEDITLKASYCFAIAKQGQNGADGMPGRRGAPVSNTYEHELQLWGTVPEACCSS